MGLGLITGAVDDDPSAIGKYASTGRAINILGWITTIAIFAPTLGLRMISIT